MKGSDVPVITDCSRRRHLETIKNLLNSVSKGFVEEITTMRTDKPAHNFRLVLLGQDGVGKSAIAVRFLCGRYLHEYDPNLESRYEKLESIDGKTTRIEVFDTANQSNLEEYLQAADAVMYVYSITNRCSFDSVLTFRDKVKALHKTYLPVLLVGNKRELEQGRTVTYKEGFLLARQCGWKFNEISAATDTTRLNDTILDFVRDIQIETKKLKSQRRGSYIKRAVSVLYGKGNTAKDDALYSVPEMEATFPRIPSPNHRLFQRRQTCPNL
ncbi:ras-like protein rasD isoform X4 [Amphiura filiformis]|uniref:ras-like protein rasD isoform X4 n=1 Tax=Amphiura filiformis TaxID=82378 RepID=UPI003B20C203